MPPPDSERDVGETETQPEMMEALLQTRCARWHRRVTVNSQATRMARTLSSCLSGRKVRRERENGHLEPTASLTDNSSYYHLLTWYSLRAKTYCTCFANMNSVNLHSKPVSRLLPSCIFYRWGNWGADMHWPPPRHTASKQQRQDSKSDITATPTQGLYFCYIAATESLDKTCRVIALLAPSRINKSENLVGNNFN